MKFDIVFSNPPYNNNLDLKILNNINEIYNEAIIVHPARWILDQKKLSKTYIKIKENKRLKYINVFWGNDLFNIGLFGPCCISYFNIHSDKVNVNYLGDKFKAEMNDISVFGHNIEYARNIKNKCKDKNESIFKNTISMYKNLKKYNVKITYYRGNIGSSYIKIASIRGHVGNKAKSSDGYNDDYYTLICKDLKYNKVDETFRYKPNYNDKKLLWCFNTEEERNNFIDYLKTKIVRFLLAFTKTGQNIARSELNIIPYLDYSKHWDDKKLCEYFGIDENEWKYIDKFIPNYYDDYNSGFNK